MLVAFFDAKGVIYRTYVTNATINSDVYQNILPNFLQHLRKKRPEKLGNWFLHQDNARPHVSKSTLEFMGKKGIKLIKHAPYSPDLAPADFWLFPTLKSLLAGRSFDMQQELETAVEGCLRQLYRNGPVDVFKQWHKRLTKCIDVGGDYVEK